MTKYSYNPFDGWIMDEGEQGMETLLQCGKQDTDELLHTEETFSLTEKCSFINEDGEGYTDLRQTKCPCSN